MAATDQVHTTNIHWVRALLPSALGAREALSLKWTDSRTRNVSMDFMWTVPEILNLARFKQALSQALRDYPHFAGSLSYNTASTSRPWSILLNNEGVPLTVGYTQHPGLYTNSYKRERDPEFYDSISQDNTSYSELTPAPLMKIKMTYWEKTGDTSLMVSMRHVAGDMSTLGCFMVTLSNYYQTSSPSHPIPLPAPTYEKYLSEDPDLDADYIDQAFPYLSYLAIDCTAEEYAKRQQEIVDRTSRVDFSFSKDQIQAISAEVRQGEKIQMSTMDILAAYVISVIQRISPTPVKQIRLVAGYGGTKAVCGSKYAPPPSTSVGNMFMVLNCKDPVDASSSIRKIADILRKCYSEIRQPETFERVYALYAYFYEKLSRTGRFPVYRVDGRSVDLNILAKVPLLDAHFGYEGRTRFDGWNFAGDNAIVLLPGNPQKLSDGTWNPNKGGVDIVLGVQHRLKPAFLRVVRKDMERFGVGDMIASKL